jgi:hypothetical protein
LFPAGLESARLRAYCFEEVPDAEIIPAISQFVVDSESMIDEEKCALATFARDLAASESYAVGE